VRLDHLTPKEIVAELDRYIVGQRKAKRAVAVALRNRWRRQQLPPELRDEVAPKNIVMMGPTGVGKTEIARRLAKLTGSPFLKVEASKFTEVGYVGRDVESMVRDLVDAGIQLVREERVREVRVRAERAAEDRLLDLLVTSAGLGGDSVEERRRSLKKPLRDGLLEEQEVEVEVSEQRTPTLEMFTPQGIESMGINLQDMFGGMFGGRKARKRMTVAEARRVLVEQEEDKLIDRSRVEADALERVENAGIIFLDEIDKICSREDAARGPDVSREGVQRDLLPIVEGTTVATKYGSVKTDHILFVAAGAFHVARPADLIPELQGRFPIRVELDALDADDFRRILIEPENSLVRQYTELLRTEDVELELTTDAIDAIADIAAEVNRSAENIGARRLYTVLERLLEDLSFEAPDLAGQTRTFDADAVRETLGELLADRDVARYIL
jgi:ATP-dependent HslUV protease ATP-binding subunit HslU